MKLNRKASLPREMLALSGALHGGAVGVLTRSAATRKTSYYTHAHQTPPDGNYFTDVAAEAEALWR